MRKHLSRNAIKESFDNLPAGICFFDENGLPVLCNRRMHSLVYAITGRDLQMRSDLTDALDGEAVHLPDGTTWQFAAYEIITDRPYVQFVAADVTELVGRREELEASTREHTQMVESMKRIVDNVTAITREEEILTMKMHIHGRVGWFLQRLRRYRGEPGQREQIVEMLRNMTDSLRGEIGRNDAVDPVEEMCRVAASLGVTVELSDPALVRPLILEAVRECVTNTIRHAHGDHVFVALYRQENLLYAQITNNGSQPRTQIREGGGFSSLRRQIQRAGGTMQIRSCPEFQLTVVLPIEKEAL